MIDMTEWKNKGVKTIMKIKFDQGDEMSPLTKKVMGAYNFCGDKVCLLAEKIETIPGRVPELIGLLLYTVLEILVTAFHEPGMEVLEMWQTAKTSTFFQMLTEVPKSQFSPPLWNIIIMPFAKMGLSPAAAAIPGLVISVATAALIYFYAPFKRIIRLLLPFSYFLFYQYGIASGAYHLTMLAFVLLAVTYRTGNKKTYRYILSLILLALSSSYGLLMSFGLGFVLLYEQCRNKETKPSVWLAVYFAAAVLITVQCVPLKAFTSANTDDILIRILYILFSALSDGFLTNTFYANTGLGADSIRYSFLAVSTVVGIVVLSLVFYFGKKKKKAGLFFVPYLFFAAFAVIVGMGREQSGMLFFLMLFWLWVFVQDETNLSESINNLRERDKKALKSTAALVIVLFFGMNLYWSASAGINDIRKEYGVGPKEAAFIKENKLDSCSILSARSYLHTIAPYLDKAQYAGSDSKESGSVLEWKRQGQPDVLYMDPKLNDIWGEAETADWNYTLVWLEAVETCWKTESDYAVSTIYIKSDLAGERGLEGIKKVYPEMK